MASIYQLKPAFQNALRPAMRGLASAGVTPNTVTVAALVGSMAVGAVIALSPADSRRWLLLPVWLFLRMALNAIDGMMARELNQSTKLGLVLNEAGDAVSDACLFLPLARINPGALWAATIFTILALLTEFCGLLGVSTGQGRQYQGPLGKSDRAFLAGLAALIAFVRPSTIEYWPAMFWVGSILLLWTCLARLKAALA